MDSTRSTCSFLGLFHTPRYVGSGVMASRIVVILPAAERKSRTLSALGTAGWTACAFVL